MPMNDDELRELLRTWEAPSAPASLKARILESRSSWWRWLFTGSIRLPVPAAVGAVLLIVFLCSQLLRPPEPLAAETTLADFQPVQEFNPRIVRSTYER